MYSHPQKDKLVQVDGGTILEFVSGERGFIGDTARHGFFEPGSVIRITAPETRNGKRFLNWASTKGSFADSTARTAFYTTAASDTQIMPIYGTGPVKLSVVGGTAKPTNPQPGDTVTVTAERAESNVGTNRHFYWHTDQQVDIPLPQRRSFMFTMPSRDVRAMLTSWRSPKSRALPLTSSPCRHSQSRALPLSSS